MKKWMLLGLGLMILGSLNCEDEDDPRDGYLDADAVITAHPMGGENVDFIAGQYSLKVFISDTALPGGGYDPLLLHVKWYNAKNTAVVQDSLYRFYAPESSLKATFLYALPGHFLNGEYYFEVSWKGKLDNHAVHSDTAYCTVTGR